MERFGDKLRAIRHSRGMTLKDLAARMGYDSHGHLSRIENNHEKPTASLVLKVSRSFGVSCDVLMKDELGMEDYGVPPLPTHTPGEPRGNSPGSASGQFGPDWRV